MAILHKVKYGSYTTTSQDWKNISKEAIDLVKQMMCTNPEKRISAEDALKHPWIKSKCTQKVDK